MTESVYSREQVNDWQQRLTTIAQQPRTTFTKKQVVEELFDTIEQALETRSYQEVADSLEEWGLEISEGSLKQYLSRYRKTHKPKAASSGRKRSALSDNSAAQDNSSTSQPNAGKSVARSGTSSSAQKATADSAKTGDKKTKKVAGTKPKNFVQMPEDL